MDNSFCWKCHASFEGSISFKSTCDSCGAYLHCCNGCKFHQVGKPNECQIPGTEQVRDRDHINYCEEFKAISTLNISEKPSVEDIAKKLFKDG